MPSSVHLAFFLCTLSCRRRSLTVYVFLCPAGLLVFNCLLLALRSNLLPPLFLSRLPLCTLFQ
jgi:hypothetical protein